MRYEGQFFESTTVQLDGNEYVECTFRNVELRFSAIAPVSLIG